MRLGSGVRHRQIDSARILDPDVRLGRVAVHATHREGGVTDAHLYRVDTADDAVRVPEIAAVIVVTFTAARARQQ